MLQRGLPVADLCYLVSEGAPHVFVAPMPTTRGVLPERPGYNYDGCTPHAVLTRMSVEDGRLMLPDGMSYRALVLPAVDTMTPELLDKIRQLVAAGATVIGSFFITSDTEICFSSALHRPRAISRSSVR